MINRVCRNLTRNLPMLFTPVCLKSVQKELINVPASKYADHRTQLKQNIWRDLDPSGKKSEITHLSKSQQWIKEIPVIRSTHDVVRCLGGTVPGAGHPQVYIQLNTRHPGEPVSCKWCGLRYALDLHHHH